MARHITREMAIPITWLLLHTPITANGVTFLGILTSFLGMIFLACPHPTVFLLGALFFQIWYLLDHVDGQVARYRKESSLTGLYFDFLSHYIVHSIFFFGLSLHAYFSTRFIGIILLGVFGAFGFAWIQSFFDCKYRAYYVGLTNLAGRWVRVAGSRGKEREPGEITSRPRRLFALAYKCCEIHVFMNLVGLFAVLNLGIPPVRIGQWTLSLPVIFFFLWSLLVPTVFGLRVFHTVQTRLIDEDFQSEFEVSP